MATAIGIFFGIIGVLLLTFFFFPIVVLLVFGAFMVFLYKTKIGNPRYHEVMANRQTRAQKGVKGSFFFTLGEIRYMWFTDKRKRYVK